MEQGNFYVLSGAKPALTRMRTPPRHAPTPRTRAAHLRAPERRADAQQQ